jgi:hypothetical protein
VTSPTVDEVTRARIRDRLRPFGLDALLTAHDHLYAQLVVGGPEAAAPFNSIKQEG